MTKSRFLQPAFYFLHKLMIAFLCIYTNIPCEVYFLDLKTDIIVPAGTEFIVNDIIIDRSDDRLGTSHTALLCENEEYDIIDYINLDDVEEKF